MQLSPHGHWGPGALDAQQLLGMALALVLAAVAARRACGAAGSPSAAGLAAAQLRLGRRAPLLTTTDAAGDAQAEQLQQAC